MTITVKDKEIVIPGQILAKGMDYLPSDGTFREKDNIISEKLGLIDIKQRIIKVITLTGVYAAKDNDVIIGTVKDINFGGWMIDVGGPYTANLAIRDTTEFIARGADLAKYYDIKDTIIAEVSKVTRKRFIDLTLKRSNLGKVKGGIIVDINPNKIPRVIGKQGSMINLIKEKTGCNITAAQNGKVWIQGKSVEDELNATKAINLIEEESHLPGLTEKVSKLLGK